MRLFCILARRKSGHLGDNDKFSEDLIYNLGFLPVVSVYKTSQSIGDTVTYDGKGAGGSRCPDFDSGEEVPA